MKISCMYSMIKAIGVSLLILGILILSPSLVKAVVMINEISPSTDPEWIELFNDEETGQDVTGFLLEDGNTSHADDLILSGTISGKGFLVFTHTKGWLNDGGDTLKLYNNSSPSAVIDQYTYGSVDVSHSLARIPNGSENWITTSSVTNGYINPTPIPAPTSTPTLTPTSTPTSTPTPASTKTPTPQPTKTSTPIPTKVVSPTTSPVDLILSSPFIMSPTPEEQGQVLGTEKTAQKPVWAIVLIGLGVIFIGGSVFLAIKTSKSSGFKNDI